MRQLLPLLLLFSPFLYADKVVPSTNSYTDFPWLTGPLLTPSALVVPGGHIDVEPYIYATFNTANYDSHWHAQSIPTFIQYTSQIWIEVGLTSWMDLQIVPSASYNRCQNAGHWVFNDFQMIVDFQLLPGSFPPNAAMSPALKLTLGEIFPTGKYQNLQQSKHLTDQGGEGSFQTSIGLTAGQLFQISTEQFFNLRGALSYTIPSAIYVRGLNAYGGGYGTQAKVYQGQEINTYVSLEYSFNRHWVLACDLVGNWQGRITYKGNPGTTSSGAIAPLGWGSSAQFSIAPAIEYNWSSRIGMIAGCWMSVGGRNSNQFYSATIAFNYYN